MTGWLYEDRAAAGSVLAERLRAYADRTDVTVLALPRGGVPVAVPIARALSAPLDILAVRKVGVPGHVELAMGAVASGGVRIANREVLLSGDIDEQIFARAAEEAEVSLHQLEMRLRGGRPFAMLADRRVILVDDGLATGSTMWAAVDAVWQEGADSVVVAVPVGPIRSVAALRTVASDVICLASPSPFRAVGLAYRDFSEVTDAEVRRLLEETASPSG
jgi:putative phosphoribosyl transferase